MNVMAAGCLLPDVCNKAVLNKSDFMLSDMRGLDFFLILCGKLRQKETNREDVRLI